MKISQTQHGNVLVLQPHGPLIGTDADEFGLHFHKVVDSNGLEVALDASQIALVDSRGLEVLVDATNLLLRNGHVLRLACVTKTLEEVLDLNELSAMFEQHATVEELAGH